MSGLAAGLRTDARVFLVGGTTSFRALFNWLSPWILVPSLLVSPVAQILMFAYVGRAAGVGDDQFFVIGNALNYAAIPCLFAMGATIAGERQSQTLALVLATPAHRLPLFLGRSLPSVATGFATAVFGFVVGSLLLGVPLDPVTWPGVALAAAATSFSCTGLGLLMGAVGLRVRDTATMGNVLFLALLVFCGTNVAIADLPGWMAAVAPWLPLTHGIEAARRLADGAGLGSVGGLLGLEVAVGAAYVVAGLAALVFLEDQSRRRATLDRV